MQQAATVSNAPAPKLAASGKDGRGPARERVTVTLPAVPFRIIDNPERKKTDAGPTPKK